MTALMILYFVCGTLSMMMMSCAGGNKAFRRPRAV